MNPKTGFLTPTDLVTSTPAVLASSPTRHPGHLPRLDPEFYRGDTAVHWTLTVFDRETGWLTPSFHSAFRELLLHAAARETLFCPAYCLMPDHIHLLWLGLRRDTDQRNGMSFLRTHLEPWLLPHKFQPQPHDHVLRDEERQHDAFARISFYILANPVRAGLIAVGDSRGRREESSLGTSAPTVPETSRGRRKESSLVTSAPTAPETSRGRREESSLGTSAPAEWPYRGAVIPGYPTLDPLNDDFWPKFWKIYQQQRQPDAGERKLPLRSSQPAV